ncbi:MULTISPECIES: hypothetical protein [unclassified Microcoleus]|uniref:hypothetical protein n=1 Tax=unclassified Microcoleus TaxID=2642155 RepID=UPI002FD57E69
MQKAFFYYSAIVLEERVQYASRGDRTIKAKLRCSRQHLLEKSIFSKPEMREDPGFANISVGAKHSGHKSLLLTNKLSAGMLRPYKIGMLPEMLPTSGLLRQQKMKFLR